MPKICPFCKKEIDSNIEVCPHCRRVLREKISTNKPTGYVHPNQKNINDNSKASARDKFTPFLKRKISKLKTIFSRKKVYAASHSKGDKYKTLILIFVAFLFFIGLYLKNNDLTVSNLIRSRSANRNVKVTGIFKEDKAEHYLREFKTIGNELANNVRSVAKFQGTRTDSKGRLINHYIYENKNLDIQLFRNKWNIINSEYENLKLDISNNKLSERNKINKILNYYKSIYFFTANELWFRAFDNADENAVKKINDKIMSTINDEYFNVYLKKTNELEIAIELTNQIKNASAKLGLQIELEELKNKIKNCQHNRPSINYNNLVDKYNNSVKDYNTNIIDAKALFSKFIRLVDVYLLFPGQKTLEQTTAK